jgi:IS4 transposase
VREVRVRLDTGKVLRILTNDLVAPAHEIAELYKQRWQIDIDQA